MPFVQSIPNVRSLFPYTGRLRNVVIALTLLVTTTAIGTLGYVAITDMSWLDAFFMTVITISTVGYQEVIPLDGPGKVFTIGLIVCGVGMTLYTLAAIAEFLVEGRLREVMGRRTMEQRIAKLKDHIILCGYGRFGRVVAEVLEDSAKPFVIVEVNLEKEAALVASGHPFIIGSALEEQVLAAAGIDRALALVLAMASDSDNVFVALSARETNPKLTIHARGETEAGIRRLRLAGATQIVSPYLIGGQRIANAILRPNVVDFLNLTSKGRQGEIDLEEVLIGEGSTLNGLSLRQLPDFDVRVSIVGIKRHDQPMQLNPGPEHRLFAGDQVVVVGDRKNLEKLASLCAP